MKICVFGSASDDIAASYLNAGEQLGEILGKRGHSLVFGAGNAGMMGAVARGFHQSGAEIIGVLPNFFPDGVIYPHCNQIIRTETMRERKAVMEDMADAFVITAGGIGTFEEFFEVLTLKQLGRHGKAVAVLNTNGYFDNLLAMLDTAVSGEFLTEKGRNLCAEFDSVEKLVDYLETYVPENINIFEMRKLGK